jgi:hypothetical protein
MPAMILGAERDTLKPSMGRVRRVTILLDKVQVLRLARLDGHAAVGHQAVDGRGVRAALVDRDLLGHIVQFDRTLEEAPGRCGVALGREQEIHRLAEPIHRAIQVLPLAADLDVRFVHAPGRAERALAPAHDLRQHRQHLQRPSMHRRMIHGHPTLGHRFFQAQTQRVRRVSAHAHQHHLQRVVQPQQHLAHRRGHLLSVKRDHRLFSPSNLNTPSVATATEPYQPGRLRRPGRGPNAREINQTTVHGEYAQQQGWDRGEGFIEAERGRREPAKHITGKKNLPSEALTASGLTHTVRGTAGSVNDVVEANALLHGEETDVFADAGYQGGAQSGPGRARTCIGTLR